MKLDPLSMMWVLQMACTFDHTTLSNGLAFVARKVPLLLKRAGFVFVFRLIAWVWWGNQSNRHRGGTMDGWMMGIERGSSREWSGLRST